MKKLLILAGCATLAAVTGACTTTDDKGLGDAPTDQQPDREVKVWPNGDTFPNVAAFCVGGNGVYTTSDPAPASVIVDDPECAEGGILNER